MKGEGALSVTISKEEKIEMMDMARSAIFLCLVYRVLRDVVKETTATLMWSRLESFYFTKLWLIEFF